MINGILVSYLRLNSIVVTLGALSVWGGLALYVTGGRTVAGLPDAFIDLGLIRVGGIPLEIFILAAAIIYGVLVLERLPYGRRLKAGGRQPAGGLPHGRAGAAGTVPDVRPGRYRLRASLA